MWRQTWRLCECVWVWLQTRLQSQNNTFYFWAKSLWKKRKLFLVTRGRAGSPWWTGCSGSLPSPFRVLAVWVSEQSGAEPCRAGEQAQSEWEELGGFGPGWQRRERARCSLGQTPPPRSPRCPSLTHPTTEGRGAKIRSRPPRCFRCGLSK